MTMFGSKEPKHNHEFDNWQKPEELYVKGDFKASKKLIQKRECRTCGFVESREIASVYSG